MEIASDNLQNCLRPHLLERTRSLGSKTRSTGEFVLYWLHHAMRARENPALDVAVSLSNHLALPLLVYQAIPERYPYASDRHHMFMLEGARDLQTQFRERGVAYAFHLQRQGHQESYLRQLCDRAAVAVTDEMPVQPLRAWTDQLAAATQAPIWCVDAACIVPMQMIGAAHDRAFQFRKATKRLYRERIHRPWEDVEPKSASSALDLPFQSIDLWSCDLGELISQCDIDHAIGPVPHTRGGTAAGYARWDEFKGNGLDSYAKRRNDPLIDGTSRLSPYLHYGMISPQRIAREAADARTPDADKYLDELLVWRELAYAFCFYRPDHESLAGLPDWARKTLADHQSDRRPAIHSWETLARGKTGDPLWDAAQRSLLLHGQLHNNVRMTWGKALLNWTPDAQSALCAMIDLNHRYALDGRDPASFGGILWCLGQFDRPFPPERPILGTVRDRSTEQHAKRLDADRYMRHTTRPMYESTPRVAVVGAGISGLMRARTLTDHGLAVTVFEKSRGVGGRMSTRRTSAGARFDHGAQYFTVRDERFERYVESWVQDGIVAPWDGRVCTLDNGSIQWKQNTTTRYVGIPGMNSVCRHLSTELDVRVQTQIGIPQREGHVWRITDRDGRPYGEFDSVITSAPALQSAELLEAAPDLQQQARATRMNGCWAVMLGFESSLGLAFDGAFVHDSPLSWIARNGSKPMRDDNGESWVVHASPEWTEEHIEEDSEQVLPKMIDAFWRATGALPRKPVHAAAHRWRYALPPDPIEDRCLFDLNLRIGACGDWCSGPRVEGAFLSGMAMAGRTLTALSAS